MAQTSKASLKSQRVNNYVIGILLIIILGSVSYNIYQFLKPHNLPVTSDNSSQNVVEFTPNGREAEKIGEEMFSFKIKKIATGSINPSKDIGCNGQINPEFVKYFYTDQFGASGFCTSYRPESGVVLKLVGIDLEIYQNFPDLELHYIVRDPDTNQNKELTAVKFLPFEGGHFSYTPVGAVNAIGRIVFLVPANQHEFTLTYPVGKIFIDTAAKQINIL